MYFFPPSLDHKTLKQRGVVYSEHISQFPAQNGIPKDVTDQLGWRLKHQTDRICHTDMQCKYEIMAYL